MDKSHDRATHRAILRNGTGASLTNYEKTGEDDYGETWSETSGSPHAVRVIRDSRNTPRAERSAYQNAAVDVDAQFLLSDDVTGTDAIRDGGGEGASVLTVDGTDYVVIEEIRQGGAITLACERVI